jgi:hypothetical protein
MLSMGNLCRALDSTHGVMRNLCAPLEHFQRNSRRIHRGYRLLTRRQQQRVPTGAASQVQCPDQAAAAAAIPARTLRARLTVLLPRPSTLRPNPMRWLP